MASAVRGRVRFAAHELRSRGPAEPGRGAYAGDLAAKVDFSRKAQSVLLE
jgi:hypothetical protein